MTDDSSLARDAADVRRQGAFMTAGTVQWIAVPSAQAKIDVPTVIGARNECRELARSADEAQRQGGFALRTRRAIPRSDCLVGGSGGPPCAQARELERLILARLPMTALGARRPASFTIAKDLFGRNRSRSDPAERIRIVTLCSRSRPPLELVNTLRRNRDADSQVDAPQNPTAPRKGAVAEATPACRTRSSRLPRAVR